MNLGRRMLRPSCGSEMCMLGMDLGWRMLRPSFVGWGMDGPRMENGTVPVAMGGPGIDLGWKMLRPSCGRGGRGWT